MSSKTGKKETASKPSSTRRHDSLADGASGDAKAQHLRSEQESNRKVSEPDRQHSKYTAKKRNDR